MAGFPREAVQFLADLRENNNRTWFLENKAKADKLLLEPGRDLIVEVGELLRKNRPDIIADPRTDRSIYRLNRDTRFSHDKTPYKTHLGLWWWEGQENRLECPGFYFHLLPEGFGWSIGCYRFSERGLAGWREALLDAKKAAAFKKALKDIEKTGAGFEEAELKRVPSAYPADHPMAPWLRHKGFYSWTEAYPHPEELFSEDAAAFLYDLFASGFKLHDWLVRHIA